MRFALLLVFLLVGCSSAPKTAMDEHCTIPVTRDAGMGVMVPGCVAWTFGPSREQAARFNAGRR